MNLDISSMINELFKCMVFTFYIFGDYSSCLPVRHFKFNSIVVWRNSTYNLYYFYIFPMCDLYSIMKFILVSVLSFRSKYILILLSEIVYKYQSVSWLMKTDRWFVIFTDFLSSWLITKTGNKVFNSNDGFGYLCSLFYQILLMYFNTLLLDAHAFRVAMS